MRNSGMVSVEIVKGPSKAKKAKTGRSRNPYDSNDPLTQAKWVAADMGWSSFDLNKNEIGIAEASGYKVKAVISDFKPSVTLLM
jgi:hypothetical protein